MKREEDLALLASLLEKAGQEFSYPPAQDVRATVRKRLEAEAQRRPWLTRWMPKWRRRWLIAVPAITLVGALVVVVYITSVGERTVPVEPTAPIVVEPPAPVEPTAPAIVEPPAPVIVSIGVPWVGTTQWALNLADDTMTRLGPDGQELGTFEVGTGLDFVGAALTEVSEAPLAGVYVHGNYAFVGGMSTGYETNANVGIRIIDLSDPSNPELVGRIPLRRLGYFEDHSHGDAVATHIDSDAFRGDVAIVLDGVPDTFTPESYPEPYGIWDVTDPSNPQFLSVLNLGNSPLGAEGGDLGDKPYDARAVAGHYFYALYDKGQKATFRQSAFADEDDHLAVVDLSDPGNPVVVGEWQDSNQVLLLGLSLNKAGTRAYVVGVTPKPFGKAARQAILYVLDIQNPRQPVEIGRYVYRYPVVAVHTPYAVPNDDDSLVIFADGSWGIDSEPCGHHGRLHVLDISDLSAIRELSTFKIAESDACFTTGTEQHYQATDIAVKGDLVYSTWLKGGLHVIDISDPTNPVEVGEFRSPDKEGPWLSDVALYGDFVITTTVWWSGMYILR
ncbi:MAG: LVIVD repeat-containing protein [Dehalococcoidia bacterium]